MYIPAAYICKGSVLKLEGGLETKDSHLRIVNPRIVAQFIELL